MDKSGGKGTVGKGENTGGLMDVSEGLAEIHNNILSGIIIFAPQPVTFPVWRGGCNQ